MPDRSAVQSDAFVGWWEIVSRTDDGAAADVRGIVEHVRSDASYAVFRDGARIAGGNDLDFTLDPDGFTDVPDAGVSETAAYRLSEDRFAVCWSADGDVLPTTFSAPAGSGRTHVELRRIADDDPRVLATTSAGSGRFTLRALGPVTSLDDFGTSADSAFTLARATFRPRGARARKGQPHGRRRRDPRCRPCDGGGHDQPEVHDRSGELDAAA